MHRPSRLWQSFSSGSSFPSGPRTLERSGFFALEVANAAVGAGDCDFAGENFGLEELGEEDIACAESEEGLEAWPLRFKAVWYFS